MRIIEDGGVAVLALSGKFGPDEAAPLRAALLEGFERNLPVAIDVAEVERMDVLCLQVLCSAHRHAASLGKTMELRNCGGAGFEASLARAGFPRELGCRESALGACLWADAPKGG